MATPQQATGVADVPAPVVTILKQVEGLSTTKYQDVAGLWTIGYGHKIKAGESFGQLSEADASSLLMQDLIPTVHGVRALVGNAPLTVNQLSAAISLAYNIGLGAFGTSTVKKMIAAGDLNSASQAFLLWDKAHVDGQLAVVKGLLLRRRKEVLLWSTPDGTTPDYGTVS